MKTLIYTILSVFITKFNIAYRIWVTIIWSIFEKPKIAGKARAMIDARVTWVGLELRRCHHHERRDAGHAVASFHDPDSHSE